MATTTQSGAMSPKSRHGFGLLWSASAISSVGDGAYLAAGPLFAAFLTNDPVAVALVAAASSAPWFLVTPWSGAVVDRVSRRTVMIVADVVRALCLLAFVALVATNMASIAFLAINSFVMVTGKVFSDAAGQALVPHVVGRDPDALSKANGRIYAAETVGQSLVGPPLGGLLFSVSAWLPFAIDSGSFAGSALLVWRVGPDTAAANGQSLWSAIREGFAYLVRSRTLVTLSVSVSAFNIGYNLAFATLVLFAKETLGVTDFGFGVLLAASACGAALLGLASAPIVRWFGPAGSIVAALALEALVWLWVASSSSAWMAGGAFVLLGASTTLVTVAAVTARQRSVPDRLLGRVVTAFRLVGNGIAPLGAVVGGVIASRWGLTAPMYTSAAFLGVSLLLLVWPLLRATR